MCRYGVAPSAAVRFLTVERSLASKEVVRNSSYRWGWSPPTTAARLMAPTGCNAPVGACTLPVPLPSTKGVTDDKTSELSINRALPAIRDGRFLRWIRHTLPYGIEYIHPDFGRALAARRWIRHGVVFAVFVLSVRERRAITAGRAAPRPWRAARSAGRSSRLEAWLAPAASGRARGRAPSSRSGRWCWENR